MVRSSSEHEPAAGPWVYFVLTFAWSWLFWGLAIVSGRPWTELPTAVLYVVGGVGPSLVALALVHLGRGGESARDFWTRVGDARRISLGWGATIVAVAFVPSLVAGLAPSGREVATQGPSAIGAALLAVAVGAAFAEELGWRGYALDKLLSRHTALTASLVVGLAWTVWHLPFYFMEGTIQQQAGVGSPEFWADMSARLPLAILFAWIYVNTGRSILAAVALHALDNVASVVVDPEGPQVLVRLLVTTGLAAAATVFWGHRTLRGAESSRT